MADVITLDDFTLETANAGLDRLTGNDDTPTQPFRLADLGAVLEKHAASQDSGEPEDLRALEAQAEA